MKLRMLAAFVGIALSLPAFPAVQAPCPGGAGWCDDFEHGPAHWKHADGTAVNTQAEAGTGNHFMPVRAGDAPLLVADDNAARLWAGNHFVEARIRPDTTPGGTPRHGWLMLRCADRNSWIGAGMNIMPGSRRMTVDLVQMKDGQLNRLRQLGHDSAPAGSFYTLRAELAGTELTVWLDGERLTATVPAALPAGGPAVMAQDGGFEFDDVRTGPAGTRPGRIGLSRMTARIGLQAGDVVRYPVSAVAGDGTTAIAFAASSSDPTVATVAVDGRDLVVTARRAGSATIVLSGAQDHNVASAVSATVGPAFVATGSHALQGRVVPAAGAGKVPADTLLRLRFDQQPTLGTSGSIRIYRAADHALVDVIRVGEEVDTLGYPGQEFKRAVRYSPIRIDGANVTIHPHSSKLAYGTEYVVAIDAATFSGATIGGQPFAGIGEQAGWRFRTRAQAPTGHMLAVDDDGPADFRTVQGALNHAMERVPRGDPVTIRIANGRYEELLYLRGKDAVTLQGESRNGVVIAVANDDGTNPGSGAGQTALSPAATGGRSVFLVEDADLLTLANLTLANTAVRAKSLGAQAEALNFSSDHGRMVARDASFLSEQDTIQVKGWTWFYHTLIAGNVDFIWGGNHAALFEESEIRSVGDSARPGGGYVVQARTVGESDPGFVFLNSRLTHGPGPAGNDVPAASTWLARPGTATSWDKVSYINCRIDDHIAPSGWSLPKTAQPGGRMGSGWNEYGSTDLAGKPLDLSRRVGGRVLNETDVQRYATRDRVFAGFDNGKGWMPSPADSKQQ